MLTIFKNNKQPFILFDFLLWFLLAIIFPTVSGQLTFVNILYIFIYLCAVYYVGELLLSKVDAIYQIPFLFKSGIYVIFGGIACGLIYLLLPSGIILFALAFIFLIDLIISKRIVVSFSFQNFICLLPFFVILFQTYELAYSTTERYNHGDGDYFYYTAIVESIKVNHSLSNALYHSGLPINYLVAPFLAPSQLADFAGISAQFSLWGVYSKLIPVICLGTIVFVIVKLYEILFHHQLTKRSFAIKQLLAGFMLLLLGPLHFLNFFKGDFKNTLFLGEGYVLPTGSPGFSLAMFFSGLILLLVFSKTKYSLWDELAIVIFLCIVTASKIALFLPLGILLGTISILWLFKKQSFLFITLLLALPCCIIIYKLTIAGSDSIAVVQFTKSGYYLSFFEELASKYGIRGSTGKKVILMLIISVFMWLSLKLTVLLISLIGFLKSNYNATTLIIASIVGFIISFLPGFFINVQGTDSNGRFLFDGKFDMAQFVRASIFLLTIVAIVFLLYLIYDHSNPIVRKGSLLLIFLWMLVISFSFFANDYQRPGLMDQSWYKEVKKDFLISKPSKMAMIGSSNYSGQTLTTAGVYPWFCTGKRENGEGYINSLSGYNRNVLFEKIFDSSLILSVRKLAADSVKNEGVDCVVASPSSLKQMQFAQNDSLISSIAGSKWLFKLN